MSEQTAFGNKERPLPAAWTDNPFQAPTAHVEDARPTGDGSLLDQPNRVGAGRGSSWWSGGWGLFRESTGVWIAIVVVLVIISMLLNLIPLIGALANNLLMPVFSGGLVLGCYSLQNGDGLRFNHLFAGFQRNFGQLALVGLLALVGIIVIFIGVFVLVLGGGIGAALMGGKIGGGAALSTFVFGGLLGLALGIPLGMAMWFAPALIVLNDLPATQAMKMSFLGCWRNLLPFLVFGIVGLLLAIVATIPIGLGWLLLAPTIICSSYVAYREIFLEQGR